MSKIEILYLQANEPAVCALCNKPMDMQGRGFYLVQMPVAVLADTKQKCCLNCVVHEVGGAYVPGFLSFINPYRQEEERAAELVLGGRQDALSLVEKTEADAFNEERDVRKEFVRLIEEVIDETPELFPLRRKEIVLLHQLGQTTQEAVAHAKRAVLGGFIWSAERDEADALLAKANQRASLLRLEIEATRREIAQKEEALRKKLLGEVYDLQAKEKETKEREEREASEALN